MLWGTVLVLWAHLGGCLRSNLCLSLRRTYVVELMDFKNKYQPQLIIGLMILMDKGLWMNYRNQYIGIAPVILGLWTADELGTEKHFAQMILKTPNALTTEGSWPPEECALALSGMNVLSLRRISLSESTFWFCVGNGAETKFLRVLSKGCCLNLELY